MCGRYTLASPADVVAELFGLETLPALAPRFNIAPSQVVSAVRLSRDGSRELVGLRWGLIPSWAKDESIGNKLINARAETVAEKPSFRAAWKQRRCLVAADGFFEWKKLDPSGKRKQPFHFRLRSRSPFAIAALWERWKDAQDRSVESCTLLTTEANETVRPVHDRMPVILDSVNFDAWLDPTTKAGDVLSPLLVPFSSEDMEAIPVGFGVNSPKNDDPSLVERAAANLGMGDSD